MRRQSQPWTWLVVAIAGWIQRDQQAAIVCVFGYDGWYKHMEEMVGSGIAFHTAFLVFGARRLFGSALIQGTWSFLPWILPIALGLPALHFWTHFYKRKFGELPEQIAQGSMARADQGRNDGAP